MANLADLFTRDANAEPPGGSPKAMLQAMKDDMWLSGMSLGDINEASAQLVSSMTQRGASTEDAPPSQVVRPSSGTTAMTPVPDNESKLAEVKAQFKLDELRRMHEQELSKGGAIKQGHYQSTGVGATIGSVVGGVATGMTPLGPVPGVLGGAAIGEGIEQAVTPGEISGPDAAGSVLEQTAYAGLGELGGGLFRMMRPVKYSQPRPLTPEQMRRKDVFEKHGIPYMAHEVTDSGVHKLFADIGESGALSPKAYSAFYERQNEARKAAIEGFADQVGQHMQPADLADAAVQVVHDSREAMHSGAEILYNSVKDDLKYTTKIIQQPTGKMIPHPQGLRGPDGKPMMIPEMVDQEITVGGLQVNIRDTQQAFTAAKKATEDAARHLHQPDMLKSPWYQTATNATGLPDMAQWNDAHLYLKEVRSEIRRVQEAKSAGSDTSKLADIGTLKKIEATLEADLGRALGSSPKPEHQRAFWTWNLAQDTVRNMSEEYRNETVLSFVRTVDQHGGEAAIKKFTTSLSPEDAKKVLKATASDPELQKSLQRSFVEAAFESSVDDTTAGNFDPVKMRKFLYKNEYITPKTDAMIPKPVQRDLKEFLDVAEKQLNDQEQGKAGSMFVKFKQSGAMFTLPAATLAGLGIVSYAHGDQGTAALEAGGAVTVLLGPAWIAKSLQNPETAKLLIEGIRYSASQTRVGKVAQQLMRIDEGFARAVQTAANVSGFLSPAEEKPEVTPGRMTAPSSVLDLK
jgi:hypothetical protein